MANTVYFDPAVGGTGLTVTDDGNPTTGLDNDGHRVRFVPALSQVVAVAGNTVTKATLAKDYAEKTGAAVETGTYSAKEYALGDLTATGGSAKNWATKTDGMVSGGEFSAKSYAVGTIAAGSSKDWAIKTDGSVSGGEFSAKHYATAAATSLAETENYAGIVMAVANIDFAGFEIVDGELLTAYIDSATSTPSIVDGEFVITY